MSRNIRKESSYIKKQVKKRMVENLQAGMHYGTTFFHPTKAELKDRKHNSRYK